MVVGESVVDDAAAVDDAEDVAVEEEDDCSVEVDEESEEVLDD